MATEFVGIELQLRGYDGVMRDMQSLERMLNGLRGQKGKIEIQSGLAKAKQELIGYRGELEKLQRTQRSLEKGSDAWVQNAKDIEVVKDKIKDCNQAIREFQYALKNFSQASFMQNFKKISSSIAHIGSAMQSAGNALTNLANPFKRFTSGILMGAGYKALNSFTSGLESGFDRYDVMKKYPKVMAAFGYGAEEAEKSINALDQSVRGLPTGLDEIVDVAQRFTATTGDIEKGTQLAIAANNAFLASMSTDTQKYQGMMQLQDVLGGKDMNAREWNSLVSSMTPAIVKMGESLGYTSENMSEFIQKVRDGKMDNEEFIKTLIKVGTEGGSVAKMAQNSKDTWQAFFANVGNAASRMLYGTIKSLDEVSQAVVGKDVNQFLSENVISSIDNATKSVKDWIKAHPEEITNFFKDLSKIDVKGFLKGFAEGLGDIANFASTAARVFGGKGMERVGKFFAKAGMWGKGLTILGGLIKGGRHIGGAIGAGGIEGAKALRGGGLFGWFGRLFGSRKAISEAERTAEMATDALPTMARATTSLVKMFKNTALISGTIALPFATGFVAFKGFKSMMSDLKEITSIVDQIDWAKGKNALLNMADYFLAFGSVSALLGTGTGSAVGLKLLKGEAIFGAITTFASGILALDMHLIKSAFGDFEKITESLNNGLEGLRKIKKVNNIGEIKQSLKQAIATFNQVTDLLKAPDLDPKTNKGDTSGLKRFGKSSMKTIENIATTLETVKTAVESINKLSGVKIETVDFEGLKTQLNSALTSLGGLLVNMPAIFKSNQSAKWSNNISGSMEGFNTALQAIGGKGGVLSKIPKVVSRMSELDQSGSMATLQSQMEGLGATIHSIYNSLYTTSTNFAPLTTNLESVITALTSLRTIIKKLNKIAGMKIKSGGFENISAVINGIKKAFGTETIADLKSQIDTFVQSIKDALQAIKDLDETIEVDVKVKLSPGFGQSVNSVVRQIKAGKNKIRAQNSGISFSIPVSVTFSVITNAANAIANITRQRQAVQKAATGSSVQITPHISTGGMVGNRGRVLYRAKGGSVFKPKGTDTIPAMLTPGEYVHRKKAVDTFGVDFMRRINQLDIRGAMDALMAKAGAVASGFGRQTIINNTYNNNQRLTQNISTNSPAFAMKNASRFVGAL